MNRFTKKELKDKFGFYPIHTGNSGWVANEATDKLGKLEDLEEEIGCPLEVVEKALMNGIFNGVPEHIGAVGLVIVFNNFALTCFDKFGNQTGCYPTNEYKKTWWLKKDKSE